PDYPDYPGASRFESRQSNDGLALHIYRALAHLAHKTRDNRAPISAFFPTKPIGFQNQTHWVSKSNPLGFKTKPIGF
ncbi:MAG: hypothetical protein IKW23_02045, partial [Kiritimatiellae bacterium]|nr:hypothetical protein [Kiritimatiellia bacterium]